MRNITAASVSVCVGLLQLVLIIGETSFLKYVGVAIFCAAAWLYWGRRAIKPLGPTSSSIPYAMSPIAEVAHESVALPEYNPLAKSKKSEPINTSGYGLVADIEFDYRDARGNDSHRHVAVEAIDKEYLQGYCHKARGTRTFAIGRVRGKVLDRESGELFSPKAWAAEARKHPINDPSLISIGDNLGDQDALPTPDQNAIEICFTGFTKADKLRLEGMAYTADMVVRQSVTKGLTHLVAGPNAGPTKLARAEEIGAETIDESEFYILFSKA